MIRRNLYVASKAAPDHRQPCNCVAYPFPHRKGGGDCQEQDREPYDPDWARECAIDFKQFEKESNDGME